MEKSTEGKKFDEGKNRYDLIPGDALDLLVKVYTYGTVKYSDNNWRKGMAWGRIFGALMRHSWAFWRGEDVDPESGLPHMAHAAWQCLTLLNFVKTKPEFDDRIKDIVVEREPKTNREMLIMEHIKFLQKELNKMQDDTPCSGGTEEPDCVKPRGPITDGKCSKYTEMQSQY